MSEDSPAPEPAEPASDDRANLFERFFPGPAPRDPRHSERLEALARAAEQRRAARERGYAHGQGSGQPPQKGRQPQDGQDRSRPGASSPPATAEDLEKLTDAIHEQTDLLRSLLDADIAIRDDARSTAQNSRTFAIAGTVIALFTFIAAAVTVVIAVMQ